MELWLNGPPTSVTTAEAIANSGVQAGVVMRATRTSPGTIRPKSSGPVQDPGGRADPAGAGADALDDVAGLSVRPRGHH